MQHLFGFHGKTALITGASSGLGEQFAQTSCTAEFKTGSRTTVKKKLGFKDFYLYTAVSPKTGDGFTLLMPCVNAEALNVYLKEMSLWLGSKKACIIRDLCTR
jgi:hypothetical protein